MLKNIVQGLFGTLAIFLLLPLIVVVISGNLGGSSSGAGISFAKRVQPPEKIQVWIEEKGRVESVDFEEYVACVVAGEMPADFHEEALKAQAVAARTYAAAKVQKYGSGGPEQHPKAPVCSTTHCQVYMSEEELVSNHGEKWGAYGWKAVCKAAESTSGQLLYYNGELATQPLFFSSSGGQTENSEDVFVSAVPYLISVFSPYEEAATHKDEEVVFTLKEMKKRLEKALPEEEFGQVSQGTIKVLSRTAGGRVDKMQIGDVTLRGTQVRSALGLSSALFTISFRQGSGINPQTEIIFTSSGSGHGVGMSQYGADGMGREGYSYKEILKHYYSGTEIY